MSYADEPYFHKPPRIKKIFGASQQFVAKSELKTKIIYFHLQQNIQLEMINSCKSNLDMKCKGPIIPEYYLLHPT
jgi:hypothetical protein